MAVSNTQPKLPKESINVGNNHPHHRPFFFANLVVICAIAVTCLSFMLMTDLGSGGGVAAGVEAAGEHNVLAKHVAFFDMNNDGIVYPWETFKGFRAIGCGLPLSAFAAVFINLGLSQKTRPGKFPSIRLPIEIKNIAKAKHGSDSGVYDSEGRFVASKFEEIFKTHAKTTPDALTGEELKELLQANREPKDYAGWLAGYTEWKILYVLCKDKNGLLHKDAVRGVYDGSLFEKMAKEKASTQKKS